jgi:hypothetical protein
MSGLTIFEIVFTLFWVLVIYEGWRAPLMRENEDGTYTTVIAEKKFRDIFKKKK